MTRAFFFNTSSLCICAATIVVALGCSSQADTDYRGEPLATLSGAVQIEGAVPLPPSVDAAIVWAQVEFAPGAQLVKSVKWVGESTPVTGKFPASFTLNIYEPPPDAVQLPCAGSSAHLAFGFLVAVDGSADIDKVNPLDAMVGQARENMVFYLDSDQPPGWECVPGLGFTFAPAKGFHLMQQVPGSTQVRYAGVTYPAYVEAPNGLATPVSILIGSTRLGPQGGISGVGGFTLGAPRPPTLDGCLSVCLPKASSCGAPTEAAWSSCNSFCGGAVDEDLLACIQSSACEALIAASRSGQPFCGRTLPAK